jgi:ABC-type bacteriocin/lantibiotic exporter with double-glycine peptidase domain
MLVLTDPFILKWLIDDVLPGRRLQLLPLVACAFVTSYVARISITGLGAMISFRAQQRFAFDLRLESLKCLDRQPLRFHEEVQVGDLMSRVDSDVEVVSNLSCEIMADVMRVAGMGLAVVGVMLYLNPRLTFVVLPFLPVFLLLTGRLRRDLGRHSDRVQQVKGQSISFLQEHLQNIVQVWLLAKEEREASRFAGLLQKSFKTQVARRRVEIVFGALVYSLVVTGVALVLSYGGYLVIDRRLTTGGLVAFYGYTLQLFGPLCGIADLYAKSQRLFSSVRRLRDMEKIKYEIPLASNGILLESRSGSAVDFRNVDYGYANGRRAIEKVNFRVEEGEKIGIVGVNGSGKSTLMRLLTRLYDVDEGQVLVGGVDVRDLDLRSLRCAVVYVGPTPMLRDGTVLENVLDGRPHASRAEVMEAGGLAGLSEVVRRQPLEWNEQLGPRTRLSTGEQQRVALARALLMRPRILILDECLSAVDAITEREILEALREFSSSLTIILISHRSYLYEWADRLVTLEGGRLLVESTPCIESSLSVA